MITYQDLVEAQATGELFDFVYRVVNDYKSGETYGNALVAKEYDERKNPDIMKAVKYIYTIDGRKVPDTFSADFKLGRGFFPNIVTQQVQFLLSNGVTWSSPGTADKLGDNKSPFDTQLYKAARCAVWGGVGYGFWNNGHVDVFSALEFAPLFDEEDGSLKAGVRWWQLDSNKPFRATLYEPDGYTDFIWRHGQAEIFKEKRPYVVVTSKTAVDGEIYMEGMNYAGFPIVPLWGNPNHSSAIEGIRSQIFAYDMIKSGFCNGVEEASFIYWAINNAPGMDEQDLGDFLDRVRRLHAILVEDGGASAEPKVLETPYQSRAALLQILREDIYEDAMAFDPRVIASGAATATEIQAAYTNLNLKTNDFEYCVLDFVYGIMELAGVKDEPTFTRMMITNKTEEVQTVMGAATFLGEEYTTKKILTILGDGDQADEILKQMDVDIARRWASLNGQRAEGNGTGDGEAGTGLEG